MAKGILRLEAPQRDRLTLLAVSDLHGHDISVLHDAVRHFTPDLIVFAGDGLVERARGHGPSWLRRLASHARLGVLAVAGNADGRKSLRRYGGPKVYDVHSQPVQIGAIRFVGLAGAPILPDLRTTGLGDPLYREEAAAAHLNASVRNHNGPVVIISHAPPRGMLDHSMYFGRDVGSLALRDFVQDSARPGLVICGHVHSWGGQHRTTSRWTIWNVATQQRELSRIGLCLLTLSLDDKCVVSEVPGAPRPYFEWTPSGELGFLAGMQHPVATKLLAGGIRTIQSLAVANPQRVAACTGWSAERASVWQVRARAHVENRPIIFAPLGIVESPRWFIDIETDPYGGTEIVWAVAIASDVSKQIVQWHLTELRGQRGMLRAVASYIDSIPSGRLLAYSGSRFDERMLTHHMTRTGIPIPSALEHAVDLHPAVSRAVAFPGSTQLKNVLSHAGIVHRIPDLDGFAAAAEAIRALGDGEPIPLRLLRYNREDVRTLRDLVASLTKLAGVGPPMPRRSRPSGGAVRKAQDQRKANELLAQHGLTLEVLASKSTMIRDRIDSGRRVTAMMVEIAIGNLRADPNLDFADV